MTQDEFLRRAPFVATLVHHAKTTKERDKWMVTIDGFTTTYEKGVGLRTGFVPPIGRMSLWDAEQMTAMKPRLVNGKWVNKYVSEPIDPNAAEVLYALANDAQSYLCVTDIDEFAREYGYDKISEVLKAWNACSVAAKFFQARALNLEDFLKEE